MAKCVKLIVVTVPLGIKNGSKKVFLSTKIDLEFGCCDNFNERKNFDKS